jgi:hypothetical protein
MGRAARPSREGAISAGHVRLAMAMYTMCDLWDRPMEAAETETESTKKIWRWRAGKIAMVVRYGAFLEGPSATVNQGGYRPR